MTAAPAWRWMRTDELLGLLERRLRRQDATFDDVDRRLAAELGVTFDAWSGYRQVRHAADRYQTRHPDVVADEQARR